MENGIIILLCKIQWVLAQGFFCLFFSCFFGLPLLLAIIESLFVLTGQDIFQKMIQFWGKFLVLNIVFGVAMIAMLNWQFGSQWHEYTSSLNSNVSMPNTFGSGLLVWGGTILVLLFGWSWHRCSVLFHLAITWLMAVVANSAALGILLVNVPLHSEIDCQLSFIRFMTTSYLVAAGMVLAISAYYAFNKINRLLAQKSLMIAGIFGMIFLLPLVLLGVNISINPVTLSYNIFLLMSVSGCMLLYVLIMLNYLKKERI